MRNVLRFSGLPLGLDADGERAVIAEMRRTGGRTVLHRAVAARGWGEGAERGASGGSADSGRDLAGAVSRERWRGRPVVVSVPPGQAILRHLFFPDLPRRALRAAVRTEVETAGAFPFDDPVFDFVVPKEPLPGLPGDRRSVVVVAASRAEVQRAVSFARGIGLRPVRADLWILAVRRAAVPAEERTGVYGVLALSLAGAELGVFSGDVLVFLRHIPVAAEDFVQGERFDAGAYAKEVAYETERALGFLRYNLFRDAAVFYRMYAAGTFPAWNLAIAAPLQVADVEIRAADVDWIPRADAHRFVAASGDGGRAGVLHGPDAALAAGALALPEDGA